MKAILTGLQSYWEMALDPVVGKKLNGASMAFIMLFVSWILIHFVTSFLFKKKNLPPCEPFFLLSFSNIVPYLELPSETLQLMLMKNIQLDMLEFFLAIVERLMFHKLQLTIAKR
jgi:hypothetical protein